MSVNYSRLKSDDDNVKSDLNKLSDIELSSEPSGSVFTVTILNKEKTYDINGVSCTTKLSQLKTWIATATGVEVPQQRLIFAGRRLDGEDKPMSEFKVTSPCRIHLFPIPIASAISSTSTSSTSVNAIPFNEIGNQSNLMRSLPSQFNNDAAIHTPIHFDEYVGQSSREVKLWSTILIFLSLMTIMDVVSALLTDASGK